MIIGKKNTCANFLHRRPIAYNTNLLAENNDNEVCKLGGLFLMLERNVDGKSVGMDLIFKNLLKNLGVKGPAGIPLKNMRNFQSGYSRDPSN